MSDKIEVEQQEDDDKYNKKSKVKTTELPGNKWL